MKVSSFLSALPIFYLSAASAQISNPVISEFMADNRDTLNFADGSSPDWIEIHNSGATTLDLTGWHLTDNSQELLQWTFPEGSILTAGDYLLVYASGENTPLVTGELHANFKLSDQGEYLALIQPDGSVFQEFSPQFPRQYQDVSYGLIPGGEAYGYFQTPTPGEINNDSVQGFVTDTTFSHKRGFFEEAFQLEISTTTPGASIYYTIDGSDPGPDSPSVVAPDPESPPVLSLDISTTTIVRAYASKPGFQKTNTDTQTYLFVDEVISNPAMATSVTGHPTWGPQMREALLEIPTISLVTQEAIPTQPIMSPPEIPVSIEMIFPDGQDGFQLDAGVERFGGQFTVYQKHALRISFKQIYGEKKLKFDLFSDTPYGGDSAVESFDQILLRNGSHDSLFSTNYAHSRGIYVRNRYFFDRQLEAGHLSMRGKFVHVYLNGIYYGQHHLMERPNADFMATHLGGEEEDYDIMKGRSGIFVSQGEGTAWNFLNANTNNYDIVEDYMDLDSYIDYMLLNFYGGNEHDWYPQHNWVAGRKREAGGKFKFFMWDNDFLNRRGGNSSTGSTANTTDNGGPGNMLSALTQHEEFKIRLADRTHKHFFNGGMLTKERVKADFTELSQRISRTIIPETARWGTKATQVYTPASFQTYVDWVVDVNAETRSDVVLNQMRSAGMLPDLAAPEFSQHGGEIPPGFALQMINEEGGIYYTTDGSDPRFSGGDVNPTATFIPGALVDFTTFAAGSDWKFYDDGSDPGISWRAGDFDDSAWESGPAPLGFGRITGTTIATQANTPGRHVSFYCRKSFEITGAASITSGTVKLHADGGAIVYLNGTEIIRDNMPAGPIDFETLSTSDGNEGVFDSFSFDHNLLIEGMNTLAVEIHNKTAGSSDMVMDLELGGVRLNEANLPIPIDSNTIVRARSLEGDEWSALTEATFLTGVPANSGNLVISKIHYNPSDTHGGFSEYLELMNISAQAVNLGGTSFAEGIEFTFDEKATLAPGQRAVLVADQTAFEAIFGGDLTIFGTYTSRLSDGGERLTLSAPDGSILHSLRYRDRSPWPVDADGSGYGLVLISPQSAPDHELPESWRASVKIGGSPGVNDTVPYTGVNADDLLEYVLGDPGAFGISVVNGVSFLEFPRIAGTDDVIIRVEVSDDLKTWRSDEAILIEQLPRAGNQNILRWGFPEGGEGNQYARLVAVRRE